MFGFVGLAELWVHVGIGMGWEGWVQGSVVEVVSDCGDVGLLVCFGMVLGLCPCLIPHPGCFRVKIELLIF